MLRPRQNMQPHSRRELGPPADFPVLGLEKTQSIDPVYTSVQSSKKDSTPLHDTNPKKGSAQPAPFPNYSEFNEISEQVRRKALFF